MREVNDQVGESCCVEKPRQAYIDGKGLELGQHNKRGF